MTKRFYRFVLLLAFCVHGGVPFVWSETGKLLVLVQDLQKQPVKGVQIGIEGAGGTGTTGDDGKALLPLTKDTNENDWVSLQILHSPPGKDLVMVSPYDNHTLVPPFKNKAENFVRVVVMQRGDLAALQNRTVLKAFAEKINKANAPKSVGKQAAEDPKANLDAVAKQFGLTSDELDKAIRAWGTKTTDPYDVGLAALYARNYAAAASSLKHSLKQREEKFATAQKDVADAAFFLGSSLYEKGKYREAAATYQRCLQIRPDDAMVLNNTALSLEDAGDYAGAEPLYRRALALNEKALGPDHTDVATNLNNLADLLREKGDYAGAEPLYRRALAITEKVLGPNNPHVATVLNNLGLLLEVKVDYKGAEPLSRRALTINEKALGPNHPNVAGDLNNLAALLYAKGDYAAAEPLYRRSLAIAEEALGPDHPHVATALDNLGALLAAKGDYAAAEPLLRRALAIDKRALGSNHPHVAKHLGNLGWLLATKGDYAEAEPLLRRALAIDEKALGPDHPDVARELNNLASVLYAKGDYAAAETLLRRALAIDEKALGPDHPTTRQIKLNLDDLLKKTAQTTAPKRQN
ncbi:MAG TPA: tetratricopeptide repeat protein [Terriglobales bacterium]